MFDQWKVFADGIFGLTENPVWDVTRSGLWFLDIPQKTVHFKKFDSTLQSWQLSEEPGALWLFNGRVTVAAQHHIFSLNSDSNRFEIKHSFTENGINKRFNDCAVSKKGQVVIGSLVYDKSTPDAKIFSYDGVALVTVVDRITTANGLGFSEDEAYLYFADTADRKIGKVRCDWRHDNQDKPTTKTIWHKPDQIARPDGLLVLGDQLWFAMFEGGKLMCIDARGVESASIDLPVWCPTKACLGGDNHEWIFLTSAGSVRSQLELSQYPLSGKVLYAPRSVFPV